MGWQSNGDATAQLYNLYFESAEQAARYCKKHGFSYTVDEPNLPRSFHGKKSYAHNFLSEAVENKIKVNRPETIASKHFKWKRGRHSMWVNQHRQPYGGEAHVPEGNKDQGNRLSHRGRIDLVWSAWEVVSRSSGIARHMSQTKTKASRLWMLNKVSDENLL